MFLKIIPVAITIRTTTMVIHKVVVWVSDPEASRGLISVKKRPTTLSLHDKVTLNMVLLFNSIFNENDMTLNIISNIFDESHVMRSMKCECSVESLMSTETFAV